MGDSLTSRDPDKGPHSPADPIQQASASGRAAAASAGQEARRAGDEIRKEAEGALADVKAEGAELAQAAKEQAVGFAEEQKRLGAEQAEGIARAVHGAADQLQQTSPQIAHYVHEAAAAVEGLARSLRDRSPGELMGQMEDLARRQPVAFFGASVLAGFALARFAKSSAEEARHSGSASMPQPRTMAGTTPTGMTPTTGPASGSPGAGGLASGGMATAGAHSHVAAAGAPGWVSADTPVPQGGGAPASARPATTGAASLGGAAARPGAAGTHGRPTGESG